MLRPTPDEFQQAYQLAYYFHPQSQVALRITQEALYDWLPLLEKGQHKRQQQRGLLARMRGGKLAQPYKPSLPRQGLIQVSVSRVSEHWERDQEQQTGCRQGNSYRPTYDDLLVRYIKYLVLQTVERQVVYSALALGCHLYQYSPTQIGQLAPDFFPEDNIRRVYGSLLREIHQRFPELPLEQRPPYGTRKVRARSPLAHERSLVQETLEKCTPWWTTCLQPPVSLLDLFKVPPGHTGQRVSGDEQRLHALLHPTCAGLERLIEAYNRERPPMRLDPPHDRLAVPAFQPEGSPRPPDPTRAHPEPLNELTLTALQGGFARSHQRRRHFRPDVLRVYIDGALQTQFPACGGVCPPFQVPHYASYLEVYGEDQTGVLPVAVFALAPVTTAVELPWSLRVTLAPGQLVTLTALANVAETADNASGWLMQIAYTVSASLTDRWWRSWCDRWQWGQDKLCRFYAHRLVPVYATGLLLLLCFSTGWLSALYWQQRGQQTPERWRSGLQTTARILLEFQIDSPEYAMRTLLQAVQGRIVDGPSSEGRYVIEVPLPTVEPQALENVLSTLRQRPDVLRYVEPLARKP